MISISGHYALLRLAKQSFLSQENGAPTNSVRFTLDDYHKDGKRVFPTSPGYNNSHPKYDCSIMNTSYDPLHGKKLDDILDE